MRKNEKKEKKRCEREVLGTNKYGQNIKEEKKGEKRRRERDEKKRKVMRRDEDKRR